MNPKYSNRLEITPLYPGQQFTGSSMLLCKAPCEGEKSADGSKVACKLGNLAKQVACKRKVACKTAETHELKEAYDALQRAIGEAEALDPKGEKRCTECRGTGKSNRNFQRLRDLVNPEGIVPLKIRKRRAEDARWKSQREKEEKARAEEDAKSLAENQVSTWLPIRPLGWVLIGGVLLTIAIVLIACCRGGADLPGEPLSPIGRQSDLSS